MVTFEQWIELMKVLGDPNGIVHHDCFKDIRDEVIEYAVAHAPRLEYMGNVVYELREPNGDCTLWLPPQRPCSICGDLSSRG
jgi:hypothetical protein